MKHFNQEFKDSLRKGVETVEAGSGVELVVTIMPRTSRFWSVNLAFSLAFAMIVLTVLMLIPMEFWYVAIYLETLAGMIVGFVLPLLFPGLKRLVLGKNLLKGNALKASQALFTDAGITNTRKRIGVLVSLVWFEREVVILADKGAEELVPPDEWEALQKKFEAVYEAGEAPAAILEAISFSKDVFARYIPREEDDVNELPDELWLH